MADRANALAALLAVGGAIVALAYGAIVPGSFNSGIPGVVVYLILTVPIFSYAAYWAFSIRRALAVPLYGKQAFGVGFVVVAVWATLAVCVLVPTDTSIFLYLQLTNGSFYFLFIVLFYWIDASVLASRRSDPLLRDTLHWSKIRIPLWIINIIVWVIPLSLIGYADVTSKTAFLNELNNGNFPDTIPYEVLNVIYNAVVIVLICGVILLPAIALRCKWDRPLEGISYGSHLPRPACFSSSSASFPRMSSWITSLAASSSLLWATPSTGAPRRSCQ